MFCYNEIPKKLLALKIWHRRCNFFSRELKIFQRECIGIPLDCHSIV